MSFRVCSSVVVVLLLLTFGLKDTAFSGGKLFFESEVLSVAGNSHNAVAVLGLDYAGAVGVAGIQFKVVASPSKLRLLNAERGTGIADAGMWGFDYSVKRTADTLLVVLWARQFNSLVAGKTSGLVKIHFSVEAGSASKEAINLKLVDVASALADGKGNSAGIVDDGKSLHVILQSIPEKILLQNYPNPFNPMTKITFTLPRASHASLKVFNVLGQEVATLVNKALDAGMFEADFSAGVLSSGSYIYRLTAGGVVETRKMLLIR